MIRGRTVTLYAPGAWTVDRFNNTVISQYVSTQIANVLISPGATSDLEAGRPDGVRVDYTVHFPKTFTGSLKDCQIEIDGARYRVIGDPKPYMDENTPTPWHMPCEVVKCDG